MMTPREILHGLVNEEWRTTTIFSLISVALIVGGTEIFDWPGTVGGTATCIVAALAGWIHAGKSIDIRERDRRRELEPPSSMV